MLSDCSLAPSAPPLLQFQICKREENWTAG